MDKAEGLSHSQIRHCGNSMYPAIQDNDLLEISIFDEPKDISEFKEGDVVFLRADGEWVVHRVVSKEGELITMGDWSMCFDEVSSVWGRVDEVKGSRRFAPNDSYLSQLSIDKLQKNRPKRWWVRLKMFVYVYWKILVRKFNNA